jgi:hypothetical protein
MYGKARKGIPLGMPLRALQEVAPQVGLEPTTLRLTADF